MTKITAAMNIKEPDWLILPLQCEMTKIYSWSALTRIKPLYKTLSQNTTIATLRWYDLFAYGISATVGSGIYAAVGRAAQDKSGPAVVISTLISGIMSIMTAFSYLEFASKIPTSGSSYVYAYSSLGELVGWFIGWNLTLEYSFAAAAIAGTWASSFASLFINLGVSFPTWLYCIETSSSVFQLNILGFVLVLIAGILVMRGTKSGAVFTNAMTILNLLIILFIIFAGSAFVKTENITKDFAPFGIRGIIQGTTFMFFAFVGFDTVCTLSADALKPKKDVPIAVLATITLATALYVAVGFVLSGMISYKEIDLKSPLANAFISVGASWASHIVSVCAMTTMFSTLFACLLGQPKIFAVMAQDGLLPKSFATISKKDIPIGSTIFTIALTGFLVLFINMDSLMDMVSVGTLFGFAAISSGLLVLRFKDHPSLSLIGPMTVLTLFVGSIATSLLFVNNIPFSVVLSVGTLFVLLPFLLIIYFFIKFGKDLKCKTVGGFVCPFVPVLPCMSIICNNYVLCEIDMISMIQFIIWTAIGLLIYFSFGIRKSSLNQDQGLEKELE